MLVDPNVRVTGGRSFIASDVDLNVADDMLGSWGAVIIENDISGRCWRRLLALDQPVSVTHQFRKPLEIAMINGCAVVVH